MQVVVHLRTVEPSDAYCGDRIADDGRGGKRSVQCSVFSVQCSDGDAGARAEGRGEVFSIQCSGGALGTEKESMWVWGYVGRERVQIRFKRA
jgi:hypothetical protein